MSESLAILKNECIANDLSKKGSVPGVRDEY